MRIDRIVFVIGIPFTLSAVLIAASSRPRSVQTHSPGAHIGQTKIDKTSASRSENRYQVLPIFGTSQINAATASTSARRTRVEPDKSDGSSIPSGGGGNVPGRTRRDSNVGCGECHGSSSYGGQAPTVTINGPTTLTSGASGSYTIKTASPTADPDKFTGIDVASSNFAGLTTSDTNAQLVGNEITHKAPAKVLSVASSTGYSFSYAMSAGLAPGTARTLYGASAIGFGFGWNFSPDFNVVVPLGASGPSGVTVTASSSNSLTLTWTGATAAAYQITYKAGATAPTSPADGIKKPLVFNQNSKEITGLSPSTQYSFTVWGASEKPAGSDPGTQLYSTNSASVTGTTQALPPSTWPLIRTGSMATARYEHTATLLWNGKVLIAGGKTASTPSQSAELYDPTTGTFSNTGDMALARSGHTATMLPNGKVLIVGGCASAAGELYDPATGTFSLTTGNMSTTRSGHTATLLNNGNVLVAGGTSSVATADLYDPSNGSFTATAGNMTSTRFSHTAALLSNGKVLLAGGSALSGGAPVATAELYDPTGNNFTATTGGLTTARKHHTMTNAFVVTIVGGIDSANNSLLSTEIYDPSTNTFNYSSNGGPYATAKHTATALHSSTVIIAGGRASNGSSLNTMSSHFGSTVTLSEPRISHTATLLPGGRVLLVGGNNGSEASPSPTASADLYDSDMDVRYSLSTAGGFFNSGSMTYARAWHTATLLPNGKVLIAAGQNAGTEVPEAELYDLTAFAFSTTGTMARGMADSAATLLANGKVLLTGGQSAYQPNYVATAELYDPDSGTFTATGSMGIKRFSHTSTLLPNGKVLIAGGSTQLPANIVSVVASAELYDPNSGTFSPTGSMTRARQHHSATLLPNGKVLIAGGDDGSNTLSSSYPELYDPNSGTFTTSNAATYYPNARQEHQAILLPNGKVLFAGGKYCVNSSCSSIPNPGGGRLYDPATDDYGLTGCCQPQTNVPGLNGGRYNSAAALLPDGRPIIIGGFNEGGWLNTAEVYDPSFDWSVPAYYNTFNTGALNTARFGHTATLLPDDTVLVVGGVGPGSVYLSSAEVFRLSSWTGFSSSLPVITATPTTLFLPAAISITGTGLRASWDTSSANTQNSAADLPLLRLQRVDNDQITFIKPSARSATNFTSTIQSGLADGYYRATIIASGLPSAQKLFVIRTVPLAAPGSPTATASSATSVAVTWGAVTGAATYEILRTEDNINYLSRGTVGVTSFNDSAQSGKSYLYKVRALDALGSLGPDSGKDLATTVMFDDDPLVVGFTLARTTHITQLRTAVDRVRTLAGLPPGTFAESITAGSTTIKASHILELRSALNPARTALGLSAVSYADSSLAGGFLIKAAHIADLRSGVK